MEQCEVDEKSNRQVHLRIFWFVDARLFFGAILTPKMMSDDDSPKHKNDCQVELYTLIHFIGPLDLVLRASKVLYYQWRYLRKQNDGFGLFQDPL